MTEPDRSDESQLDQTFGALESTAGSIDPGSLTYDLFISYSHATKVEVVRHFQRALSRIAKPWYQRRGLRVFRDETDLSATPELWPTIEIALSQSRFFLLVASPMAARSKWVRKEIDFWVNNKTVDQLLILVTDGEIHWDEAAQDFDWDLTTAIPGNLAGAFKHEPLYVDLVDLEDSAEFSVADPRFRDAVASIAAAVQGKSKSDIIGEDLKRHRQTLRTALSAVIALVLLTVFLIFATYKAQQRAEQLLAINIDANLTSDNVETTRAVFGFWRAYEDMDETDQRRDVALRKISWNARLLPLPHQHAKAITGYAVSEDGSRFATSGADKTIRVWNTRTGRLIGRPIDHFASSICFGVDDSLLITGATDGRVTLWDIEIGKPIFFVSLPNEIQILKYSPSRKVLVVAGGVNTQQESKGNVTLLDPSTLGSVARLSHANYVFSAALNRTGDRCAIGDYSGKIQLLEVKTNKPVWPVAVDLTGTLKAENYYPTVEFAPDETSILAAVPGGESQLLDVSDGKVLRPLMPFNQVAISEDKRQILSVGNPTNHVYVLDAADWKWKRTMRNSDYIQHIQWLESEGACLAGTATAASIWDAPKGQMTRLHRCSARPYVEMFPAQLAASFGRDSSSLVTLSKYQISIWKTRSMEHQDVSLNVHAKLGFARTASAGTIVLTQSGEGDVEVRNMATLERIKLGRLPAISGFAVGDEVIALSTFTTEAYIYNAAGELLKKLTNHDFPLQNIFLAPDERTVLTVDLEGVAHLWDRDGRLLKELRQSDPGEYIAAVAFSPDGETILTAGQSVQLWDARSYEMLREPIALDGPAVSAAFAHDGKSFVVNTSVDITPFQGNGGMSHFWDLDTGISWGKPLEYASPAFTSQFSADGSKFLTVHGQEGLARLWTIPPPAVAEDAKGRLRMSVEMYTGLARDQRRGEIRHLSYDERTQLYQQLESLGGLDHVGSRHEKEFVDAGDNR